MITTYCYGVKNPLLDHIAELCATHGISICDRHQIRTSGANPQKRTIHIPPVRGHVTYAVALHEIGHILHPQGMLRDGETGALESMSSEMSETTQQAAFFDVQLIEEASAWQWAITHAKEWTPVMARTLKWSFHTYTSEHQAFERFRKGMDPDPLWQPMPVDLFIQELDRMVGQILWGRQ